MLFISATVSSGSRTLVSSRFKWPSMPQHGRLPDGDVQVARLALDDRLQQFVDKNSAHGSPSIAVCAFRKRHDWRSEHRQI